MREVQSSEAKDHLSQLLDEVEQGETIAITRHGRRVARLVPDHGVAERETVEAKAAATRLRTRSKGVTLGGLSLNDLINEGRA